MLFDIGQTTVSGRPRLTVRGELDLTTAPQLGAAVAGVLASGVTALTLDLTPTKFLDSSGARELVRLAREARIAGVEFHVVAPASNRPVRLVVDLLDLSASVPLVESEAEIPSDGDTAT